MKQRMNSMWLDVSVPVLSEKMCVTCPSSSVSEGELTRQHSSWASSYMSRSLIMKRDEKIWMRGMVEKSVVGMNMYTSKKVCRKFIPKDGKSAVLGASKRYHCSVWEGRPAPHAWLAIAPMSEMEMVTQKSTAMSTLSRRSVVGNLTTAALEVAKFAFVSRPVATTRAYTQLVERSCVPRSSMFCGVTSTGSCPSRNRRPVKSFTLSFGGSARNVAPRNAFRHVAGSASGMSAAACLTARRSFVSDSPSSGLVLTQHWPGSGSHARKKTQSAGNASRSLTRTMSPTLTSAHVALRNAAADPVPPLPVGWCAPFVASVSTPQRSTGSLLVSASARLRA